MNDKETLEEAAQKFYPPTTTDLICSPKLVRDGFIAGAKWQAERSEKELEVAKELYLSVCREKEKMFVKEEMWQAYKQSNTIFNDEVALRAEFEEWFEKFKKK